MPNYGKFRTANKNYSILKTCFNINITIKCVISCCALLEFTEFRFFFSSMTKYLFYNIKQTRHV